MPRGKGNAFFDVSCDSKKCIGHIGFGCALEVNFLWTAFNDSGIDTCDLIGLGFVWVSFRVNEFYRYKSGFLLRTWSRGLGTRRILDCRRV